ncbi:ATP-binding protein [Cognatishimia sp. SS12]|nr:ATP-binding protein [Cognatishimia sp. SS12]
MLSFAAAWVVYQNALSSGIAATAQAGQVRLSEVTSTLRLQLSGFRTLANVLANEPILQTALVTAPDAELRDWLADFQLTYGAWHIDLADPQGRIIASSGPAREGQQVTPRLMAAALNARLEFEHVREGGVRLTRFARGLFTADHVPLGVVVVSAEMAALEFEWPVAPEPVVFFDADNQSFIANRPELLGLSLTAAPDAGGFPILRQPGPHALWRLGPPANSQGDVLRLERFIAPLDLRAEIFVSVAPAQEAARLRFALALATALVIGLIGAIAVQQRRQLAFEADYSATLEARVEARTAELRKAQGELVEASKLAALGRLSAGISHELNQPLAAILNFAENGRKFLAKGRVDPVSDNLALIGDQVRRMTRIINNLRAFARKEVMPTEPISFRAVVENAYGLVAADLAKAGVAASLSLPDDDVDVLAGRVRLEQVVLNLLTNAMDAMATSTDKNLLVSLDSTGSSAALTVRDTGSGIQDPDRVFEPFYTTKNLGASQGLGLGLSLALGIIQQFGGQLSCRNLAQGAEFKITLPLLEDTQDV